MREIKFRAFDKKDNEMFYSSMYQDKTSMAYGLGNFLKECGDIEDTLMQCTELKDKNKVEIYNKDIIKDGSRLWIVEISSLYGVVLRLLKDKKITRPYVKFEKHLIIDFEFIGNLYENPELLKDTK